MKNSYRTLSSMSGRKIPADPAVNVQYRNKIIKRAESDKFFRKHVWDVCANDFVWWLSVFGYTYRPHHEVKCWPFIPWPYQVEAAELMKQDMEMGNDRIIIKSRDMGATWLILMLIQHDFLFSSEPVPHLLLSRTEALVEKSGNPDSLMWKLDYNLRYQPEWLIPEKSDVLKNAVLLHRENPRTGSVIDGIPTTGDMNAGGRRKAGLFDEFARVNEDVQAISATSDVMPCRFFCSTFVGRGNEFFRMYDEGNVPKLEMHWTRHPEKARGLYKVRRNGDIEIVDKNCKGEVMLWRGGEKGWETYNFPDEYPFETAVNDPELRKMYTLRSPYFDSQCNRRKSAQDIAENLEMDPGRSGVSMFDPHVLERIKRDDVEDPICHGELIHRYDEAADRMVVEGFDQKAQGRMAVWGNMTADRKLPQVTSYVVGVDVSQGTGASNSVATVYDANTKEQAAELAIAHLTPVHFARYVVSICQWLGGLAEPYLIWEMNGPGLSFGKEVIRLGWKRVYYEDTSGRSAKYRRKHDTPGWQSRGDKKRNLLDEFVSSLARGEIIPRSEELIVELYDWILDDMGRPVFSKISDEKAGARERHGDRVTAHAVANRGLSTVSGVRGDAFVTKPPKYSLLWRERRERQTAGQDGYWEP